MRARTGQKVSPQPEPKPVAESAQINAN
jgi:hypothetical protein